MLTNRHDLDMDRLWMDHFKMIFGRTVERSRTTSREWVKSFQFCLHYKVTQEGGCGFKIYVRRQNIYVVSFVITRRLPYTKVLVNYLIPRPNALKVLNLKLIRYLALTVYRLIIRYRIESLLQLIDEVSWKLNFSSLLIKDYVYFT